MNQSLNPFDVQRIWSKDCQNNIPRSEDTLFQRVKSIRTNGYSGYIWESLSSTNCEAHGQHRTYELPSTAAMLYACSNLCQIPITRPTRHDSMIIMGTFHSYLTDNDHAAQTDIELTDQADIFCAIASPVWEPSKGSVLRLYFSNRKLESTKWTVKQMNDRGRYLSAQMSDVIENCGGAVFNTSLILEV